MFVCKSREVNLWYMFVLLIINCVNSMSNFRLHVLQSQNTDTRSSNHVKSRTKRDSAEIGFAESYLVNYGYVPPDSLQSGRANAELHSWSKALAEMQKFHGLPQTGEFDDATIEIMKKPRCANPDKVSVKTNLKRKKRYVTVGSPWQKQLITYSINNFTPKLGKKLTHEAIDNAFKVWSSFVPLQFDKVDASQNPDIVTFFAEGFHNDNTNFDGVGGYLAHAFYPGSGIGGDTHFDGAEPWTLHQGPNKGNDLFLVAVHELGHALGLQHSPDVKAIMAPVYKYHDTKNFVLPQDDILGIQSLYGARFPGTEKPIIPTTLKVTSAVTRLTKRKPMTPRTKPPRRPAATQPTISSIPEPSPPKLCELSNYDAISFLRKELYIFKGKYMWRRKRGKTSFSGPLMISSFWPQLKNGVDAVYENPTSNKIVFFKDHLFWEFRGTELLPQSPRHVRHIGMQNGKVDAAVWWQRNGKTYFFKGGYYWRYGVGRVEEDYPRSISVWNGAPANVDAAFSGVDGSHNFTYFVKGNKYWVFNNWEIKTVKTSLSFVDDWLKCGLVQTERKMFETVDSAPVTTVIIVCTLAVGILIAAVAYIIWRKHRVMTKEQTITRIASNAGVPYQAGYGVPLYDHEGEKTMCVTTAQQKLRWFRFSLQGRV